MAAIAGLMFLPRLPFAALTLAFALPFAVWSTQHEIDRLVPTKGSSTRGLTAPPDHVLNWVDTALPAGARAAMVPFPQSPEFALNAVFWWDLEFWNKTVSQTYVGENGDFTYAPFPDGTLAPDWQTGRVANTATAPPFVILADNDPRVGLSGQRHAVNFGLSVLLVDRPYRAVWMTRGLDVDGWTLPKRPVSIRVYSQRNTAEVASVRVVLGAPATRPAAYALDGRTGHIAPGQFADETRDVCVPSHSYAQLRLRGLSKTSISVAPTSFDAFGTRLVGVRVGSVKADFSGKPC